MHHSPAAGQETCLSEDISRDHATPSVDAEQVLETPLPKLQLFLLLYLQLAEPVTSTVIYPFVNQLVRQTGVTGGDERKTGYFAGLIVRPFGVFFSTTT